MKYIVGDCREALAAMGEGVIDACVTDPPYHLTTGKRGGTGLASVSPHTPYGRSRITTGFMGKAWDGGDVAMQPATWAAVLRVLKPGAHLLAFGGTRTFHRMAVAIEDAGFEIRDCVMWLYGTGFPKSLNVGDGRGTALKPAWEPIIVARKPLIGSVAANVLAHGTGAYNIDECRIPTDDNLNGGAYSPGARGEDGAWSEATGMMGAGGGRLPGAYVRPEGRWPANVIHDGSDEVLAAFPAAPGQLARARTDGAAQGNAIYGALRHVRRGDPEPRGDAGSAARFFYSAKASKADRAGSKHPTVKPLALMRYLCRLVTPPGGTVLDPFAGSGTTGEAALREGFEPLLIEAEAEYGEDIRRRLLATQLDLLPADLRKLI